MRAGLLCDVKWAMVAWPADRYPDTRIAGSCSQFYVRRTSGLDKTSQQYGIVAVFHALNCASIRRWSVTIPNPMHRPSTIMPQTSSARTGKNDSSRALQGHPLQFLKEPGGGLSLRAQNSCLAWLFASCAD